MLEVNGHQKMAPISVCLRPIYLRKCSICFLVGYHSSNYPSTSSVLLSFIRLHFLVLFWVICSFNLSISEPDDFRQGDIMILDLRKD